MQTIQQFKNKIEDLEVQLKESKEDVSNLEGIHEDDLEIMQDLREEASARKEACKKVQTEKAGKASALVRLKRKFSEMEDENDDNEDDDGGNSLKSRSSQTNVTLQKDDQLIRAVRDTGTDNLKHVEVLIGNEVKGEGMRSYGESTFIRLPSARASWPNDNVGTRAVKSRAATIGDIVSLMSGSSGGNLSKEESDQIN